jgi:hypothetical protein
MDEELEGTNGSPVNGTDKGNDHGGFGRWAFIEIADPWDVENIIRSSLQEVGPVCRTGFR